MSRIRFRYSGLNWEGRPWKGSAPLVALGTEVEAAWPERHGADGTVAGKRHDQSNPRSDHRPKPFTGPGIVRAIDVGIYGDQGETFTEALRASRDPRIKYVLHNRRIFSSYSRPHREPWEWAAFEGAAHLTHVHVSFTPDDLNGDEWGLDLGEGIDMKEIYARKQAALIRAGYDLGDFPPYLPADDPDSLPGADGDWGNISRTAETQFMADAKKAAQLPAEETVTIVRE